MFSLNNQIALVTGGANGIGKGIVKMLQKAGAHVIIADIDENNGQKTAEELGTSFLVMDVTDGVRVESVIQEIVEKYGRLDILCANTGIFPQQTLEKMTEEDWDHIHNVNSKGTFLTVKAAVKQMRQQKYGRIILTSSITGPITGFPGWSHYGATKAGQLGFMRSVALEYAKDGITINAIQPGNILSEGLKAQGEKYLNQMKASIPTHTLGKPEDIGSAAVFFASKEASYITGQALVIDGGQILPESPEALI